MKKVVWKIFKMKIYFEVTLEQETKIVSHNPLTVSMWKAFGVKLF